MPNRQPDGTLLERMSLHAEAMPERIAYTFLRDGQAAETLTFAELTLRVRCVAAALRGHAAPGERALLLYPPGLEFIVGFLGCLAAGIIAVPAYPPRRNQKLDRLGGIIADCSPRLVLTTSAALPGIDAALREVGRPALLATDSIDPDGADSLPQPLPRPDAVAYLQYTSGSTGTPKGVVLTHQNIAHNEVAIQHSSRHDAERGGGS